MVVLRLLGVGAAGSRFCGELPLDESISYIQDIVSNQSAGGWVRFAFDALDLFSVSQLRKGAVNGVPEVALQHMLDNMYTIIMWLYVHIIYMYIFASARSKSIVTRCFMVL